MFSKLFRGSELRPGQTNQACFLPHPNSIPSPSGDSAFTAAIGFLHAGVGAA